MKRKLRLVTYNVKRFVGADGKSSTAKAVGEGLRELRPHLVSLNEVERRLGDEDVLETVGKTVFGDDDFHVAFWGHAAKGKYGNAIVSRLPLSVCAKVQLRGGSKVEFSGRVHHIVRGILLCRVDGSQDNLPDFLVASTHLDHISEQEREIQLQHVWEVLRDVREKERLPVVLCGDFNALKRKDYSREHWNQIVARHERRGWNLPTEGCLNILERNGEFLDAFDEVRRRGPGERKFTASVENPLYRVDYCFARECFLSQFQIEAARVVHEVHHSDHFPLLFEFKPKTPSKL